MQKKKKILAIACMPIYQEKGSTLRLYSILQTLSKNYEIDLVAYSIGTDIEIENVKIHRTPKFFKPYIGVGRASYAKIMLDMFVFLKVLRLLTFSPRKYEILHCEDFEAALLGYFLKKVFKKRMIYVLHNRIVDNWEISNKKLPFFVKPLEKKTVASSDLIISNWQMYLKDPIFLDKKMFLHYDNVEFNFEEIEIPFEKYLLYCGNFEKYQGVLDFLEIYKQSNCQIPLVLAGEPNTEVLEFLKENNLEKKVKLVGKKTIQQANFLIKNSSFCILPRIFGVQPSMKMIHYLLWEKPVIAKDISCNTELIKNNYNGFLYNNEKELKDILNTLDEKNKEGVFKEGLKETKKEIEKYTNERRFLYEYGG